MSVIHQITRPQIDNISAKIESAPPSDNLMPFPSDYWKMGRFMLYWRLQPNKKDRIQNLPQPILSFHNNMGFGGSPQRHATRL